MMARRLSGLIHRFAGRLGNDAAGLDPLIDNV